MTQWHCNEATEVHNGEFVEAIVYLNPILPGIICHLSIKMRMLTVKMTGSLYAL